MSERTPRSSTVCACLLILSCILLLLFTGATSLRADETPPRASGEKRVVILYSQPRDFPATEMVEKGIHEELDAEKRFSVQLFSEYLDLSRFRDAAQRQALADLLRQRYSDSRIDLLLCVDVPAASFLMEYGEQLFPAIPVVMCSIPEGVKDSLLASPLGGRVSGIIEPASLARRLVESAFLFKPSTQQVVLVAGAFENDEARAVALREALKTVRPDVELIDLTGCSLGEILERCQKLSPETVIFFSTLFVDGKGRSFVPKNVLQSIAAVTDRPIFGPYESYMGYGIIGGPLISLRLEGKMAAEQALRILGGQAMEAGSFSGANTHLTLYDWRQLKRHAINENLLSAGGVVLFREPTLWDQYKYSLIGIVALVTVQSLLILGLVVNLRQRKKAEAALRASQRELQTLAGRLISSQEEELSRLSREFHDDFAQRLAAVAIETGTLEIHSQQLDTPLREKIGHVKEQLINLSDDIHAISRELHPAILKDLGLGRAVNSLCINFADRENIPVDCHFEPLPDDIPSQTSLCIYRVIQESLRNIAKHARARHVDISLKLSANHLLATVEDDGAGFEPKCARHTPGIGLASMRERVQYVKGEFTIQSEPGQGTVIELSIPLPRVEHEKTENTAG
jgi:signal transduction histidine kinase